MNMSMIRTVLATALLSLALSAPALADVVLQWASNNNNVTLRSGVLVAVGNTRDAARFEVVRLEGNRIALRAADGSYVRAGVGQQTLLATGSPHIRGWETFELDRAGGNSFSLRSVQNGKFVELDRTGRLAATSDFRGTHAQVRLITVEDRPQAERPGRPDFSWTGQWGQVWVTEQGGRRMSPPRGSNLRFAIDRQMNVSASAGCNSLGSHLAVRGQRASFSPAMMTRMHCGSPQQRFEQSLARAMENTRSWEYREGQIAFMDGRGRVVMQIGR